MRGGLLHTFQPSRIIRESPRFMKGKLLVFGVNLPEFPNFVIKEAFELFATMKWHICALYDQQIAHFCV